VTDFPVLAANNWPTNGDLIADLFRLRYVELGDSVLDATYGRGLWWTKYRPGFMVTNDIVEQRAEFYFDFRTLPEEWANRFDLVAYDPPYVCVGGRTTTGIPDLHDRYGLTDAPKTPRDLQKLMDHGLTEMKRVTRPGGLILMKCQDYISSGKLWAGTYRSQRWAEIIGLELVDRFEHIGHARPQPPGRRQVHARRNLSTLFVFRKGSA
jgi:hypothetical protein